MGVAEKLVVARGLLERAREVLDAERDWLLALAWGKLAEGAEALASALGGASAATREVVPARGWPTPTRLDS